jgi:hypothetical protein
MGPALACGQNNRDHGSRKGGNHQSAFPVFHAPGASQLCGKGFGLQENGINLFD